MARVDVAVHEGAELVRDRAKERAPDATPLGEGLVAAIHVNDSAAPRTYSVVAGDNDAFYGHMVEFGTSHTAPRPFLIPALEESKPEIMRKVRRAAFGR